MDAVDPERDQVPHAAGGDVDLSLGAVEDEGHGDDRLEGVALRPSVGGDVGLAVGDPDREVEDAVERLDRDPRAVVGDLDPILVDRDGDDRRDAGILARVEGVIDELLERDQRPLILAVAGLGDQLLA